MTVRRWELGKTSPKTEEIKKLAEALNTSVEYLMGLNDSEEKTPQEQNIPININNAPEVSNDDLDLSYWGGVAERASRAARSGDVQKLAAISLMLKLAQEAVEAVVNSGEGQGILREYGLYYKMSESLTGYRIAFADTSVVTDDIGKNVLMLFGFWVVLMLAIFAITIFLSRYVARPVENAWKDQQRFIADASHELKTPLTIIMADATILSDNSDKTVEEQRAWVDGISAEASRMQRLTEDMLTLAQADAGIDRSQLMSDMDFSSTVEMQVLQFDAVAFERGLTIEDEVEEGLHIVGDGLRIENMVKTLLENACKYAEKPSTIHVKLAKRKNEAVFSVHNAGKPIPAEDLPHLFDRFYRSDKARVHEGETASFGLGLSIAKSTVELHGGTIGVKSDEGGTTFTVRMPLSKR